MLNKSRAKRLADYIVDGQESRDAFLPTSIFLATERDIPFKSSNNTIEIDTSELSFNVVDGQHRIKGLEEAAERDDRVSDFEVPVNIAVRLPRLHQMAHFLIVNTTQKGVEEGIAQRIRSNFSRAADTSDLPTLPRWINRLVNKGDDDKGLQIVDYLYTKQPWRDRIVMANDESPRNKPITQKSFVTLLKKHYFVRNNTVATYEIDRQCRISESYWRAIANVIGTEDSVLFKYTGVQLFLMFCPWFFLTMSNKYDRNPYETEKMQRELQKCFDEAMGEATGVGHADFWRKGGKASGLNSGAVGKVCTALVNALHGSLE